MTGIMGGSAFLVMWIGFMALMIIGLALILLWAVRARQFENQDRARYLPLDGPLPEREEND